MNLDTLEVQHRKLTVNMSALLKKADEESRGLTDVEEKSFADWQKEQSGLETQIKKLRSDGEFSQKLTALIGDQGEVKDARFVISRASTIKTFGQLYVESEAFKWHAQTKATRSGQWTSPSVELERKAALTEDPASGGALVPPDRQAGIVSGAVLPVVVADLLMPGTTNSNVVPVMMETAFTNAAAPVAEGAVKPESTLTFALQSEPVRKLAHWIPISEELLEDAPAVASYIDARLRYGLLREEDQQLLSGTGVAPELLGLLNRPGLAADVVRTNPQTNADAILQQIVAIESTTGLPVSGVVMHPAAWSAIIGSKLTDGSYLVGGPLATPTALSLWNRQVVLTDQITNTVALVGAFKTAAQIFRHGGIRVNSTNAHSDFFVKNMVALRIEERIALATYRNSALGRVTTLTTAP
jgi:HK97 family phage major capsid protein